MKDYWHDACKPAVDYKLDGAASTSSSSNTHFSLDNLPLCDLRRQKANHKELWTDLRQVYDNWRDYKTCTKQFGANPDDHHVELDNGHMFGALPDNNDNDAGNDGNETE